uniref:Basic tail secreted protein n=1 Tax=Rhipicephalus appendiculatus TaxID=34631 RepID=A0A131Z675_RHIAP
MSFALNITTLILACLGSITTQAPRSTKNAATDCPPRPLKTRTKLLNGTIIEVTLGTYNTCTCTKPNGAPWMADNGSPCTVVAPGYNEEHTAKAGTCKSGTCFLTEIEHGCEDNKTGILVDGQPQVGCAHTCFDNEKKRKFGYYAVGTQCTHLGENGRNQTVTTCKQQGQKVICRESVPDPLAC